MTNTQAPEPVRKEDGATVEVHSVFYTIQGEGPFAGQPAIFIRLAGCNMQCPGCDTLYTENRQAKDVDSIAKNLKELRVPADLVVVTGGEPFRQNITGLVTALQVAGYYVQIETNGTLPPSPKLPPCAIVCSPKAGRVHPDLVAFGILAYKYVCEADYVSPVDGMPLRILGADTLVKPARPDASFEGTVYLSPMDEQDDAKNLRNRQATVDACMKFGHTLNLQLHKIVHLP